VTEVDVLAAGLLTTLQDLGRPGLAHLGVPPSGAVDSPALELGNRLVGNPPGAAALEATLVGPRLRFHAPALVALTGAESAMGVNVTVRVGPGELLDVGPCRGGARVYVCVRGGFEVPAVLGSRSTDLLTGIGPPPLRDGDVLTIGPTPAEPPHVEIQPVAPPAVPTTLRLLLGPRDEWLARGALDTLFAARWTVTNAANRIGVRLDGPKLEWARDDELPSEGLVTGALQVPPSGHPILLLNDHPTTGGYPAIAVVESRDLPRAGQLRPGDTVSFLAET
jgi:biotin-dependent carboxylase-like uncharacterized protein